MEKSQTEHRELENKSTSDRTERLKKIESRVTVAPVDRRARPPLPALVAYPARGCDTDNFCSLEVR